MVGYGMTDNDVAMAAIDRFVATHLDGIIDEDYETIGMLPSQSEIDAMLVEEDIPALDNREVLGLAEFLLDHGYNVEAIHDEVVSCYDAEVSMTLLNRWDDPDARLEALRAFLRRVDAS